MSDPDLQGAAYHLFVQALELSADQRQRYIDEHCAGNDRLRAEVLGLLGVALADADATAAFRTLPPEREPELAGLSVGRFKLLERVGAGGMGVVYRAERTDGVLQSVAIKLLSNALDARARPRFEREAQLLARLEHPSIARLIDAGIKDERAWIAIEYVKGQRIDAYCTDRQLDVREIVRLLIAITEAVAAAHRMLVVHSDIKPGNVLVSAEGAPKLVDFGIATALRDADENLPAAARADRYFSPNYAAPEQVDGGVITVATDVFGLGALAYRLLTGSAPYAETGSPVGYQQTMSRSAVQMPSRVARAGGRPEKLVRALQGDLDAIIVKALARDPALRYGSADDLNADLRRYLDRRPVHALPVTPLRRASRFLQRNAVAASLGGLLAVSMVGGGIAYALQARHAALANAIALRRGEFLASLIKSANPRERGTPDLTVAQLLDTWTRKIDQLAATEPLVAASLLELVAETDQSLDRYQQGLEANAKELTLLRAQPDARIEVAQALGVRGGLLSAAGRLQDALAPLRESIAVAEHARGQEKLLGEDLGRLANTQRALGREKEAAASFERELALYRKTKGALEEHELDALDGLATVSYEMGNYAESARYIQESLAVARKFRPEDDPEVLDMEHNLVVILQQEHQYPEAETLARQLIGTKTRVFGPEARTTLFERQALASDLISEKRYAEAEAEGKAAADGLLKLLGEDSETTQQALGIYGTAACKNGDGAAGIEALRRAEMLRAKRLGPDHFTVQNSRVKVAICLIALGRYAEAEPILLSSVASLEKSSGARNNRTQSAYVALRDLYLALGRPVEAATWGAKLPADKP